MTERRNSSQQSWGTRDLSHEREAARRAQDGHGSYGNYRYQGGRHGSPDGHGPYRSTRGSEGYGAEYRGSAGRRSGSADHRSGSGYRSSTGYTMRGESRSHRRGSRRSGSRQYGSYGSRGAHAASHRMPRGAGRNGRGGRMGRPRPKHLGWKIFFGVLGGLIALGLVLFAFLYATLQIPTPEQVALAQKTNVYYSDGKTPIGTYSQQNRKIIGCQSLPSYVGNAVVSSENRTFWTDPGVDGRSIVRALLNNVSGGARQGASTITQQYVERYYLGETTSYPGKVKEAILALKIAQSQSKSTVLCNYLNTIYFGRDSYGIQAAAKSYFNKDAKDLTVGESAMLAGIIPAPNSWAPDVNPTKATQRYQRTLRIMRADKHITDAQFAQAMANVPKPVPYEASNQYAGPNGYLLKLVEQELTRNQTFTLEELQTSGYSITTTIDKNKQDIIQKIGDHRVSGEPDSISHAGISVNSSNGEVEALYSGDDYLKKQLNMSTQATFQPGSTMKPFTLLAAVSKGMSLESVFDGSSPRTFPGLSQPVRNYGNANYGRVNMYQAVAESVNTAFVDLNHCVGPQTTAATMAKAGIQSKIDKASLYNTLGINSMTAYDLARGYTTIADGGIRRSIHVVRSVTDAHGHQLYAARSNDKRVFSKQSTNLVRRAMEADARYGFSTPLHQVSIPLASKSGIANDSSASDEVVLTPTHVAVFAIWNTNSNGDTAEIPASFQSYGEVTYPAQMFATYANQAWAGQKAGTFESVTDTGRIGGPNGDWGLGYGSSTWSMGTPTTASKPTTVTKPKTDDSDQEQKEEDQNSASGSGSGSDDENGGSDANSDQSQNVPGSNGTNSGTSNGGTTDNETPSDNGGQNSGNSNSNSTSGDNSGSDSGTNGQ